MADMFVHAFVENLRELMISEHPAIIENRLNFQFLHSNVYVMSSFLKKTEQRQCSAGDKVNELLTEIRDVVHQAENFVDSFVQEAILAARGHARTVSGPPWPTWQNLRKLIEKVKISVDQMNAKLDQEKLIQNTVMTAGYRSDDGKNTVEDSESVFGIEEKMDKLFFQLTDGSKSMEMISIVGLPGIGKSTVAQRAYYNGRIKSTFPIRAWSTVSQTYDCKRLLIDILHSSSLFEDGDDASTADQLGEALHKRLKGKRYLVVLDDVWSIEAWDVIKRSFPEQHNGSRVLFTSRFAAIGKDVSNDVNNDVNTHYMSGLSEEQSWNLLKNKVFGDKGQCPSKLLEFGKEMARKCSGLPLAIVVTGGLLAKKDKTPEFWKQFALNFETVVATDREASSFVKRLELSYQQLPVHLKACFLYLGSFPPWQVISLRRLIWLLIAEGFVIIQGTVEKRSLEVTAEGYINELVEWSLVTVAKKGSCGAIKAVRIHDLLRKYCRTRGMQEKFICSVSQYPLGTEHFHGNTSSGWESMLKEYRRFHFKEAMSYPFLERPSNLRSFFCHTVLHSKHTRDFFALNFTLLKVLHLGHIYCSCLVGLENLVHLRYFSFFLGIFPSLPINCDSPPGPAIIDLPLSVTKLLNLETLFLLRGKEVFHLPHEIWNMIKLRHLYKTVGIFHFQAFPPQGAELGNLQTLHSLCACDSCLTMLKRTPNIRKLGLSGDFRSARYCTLVNLRILEQLETLKVIGLNPRSAESSTPLNNFQLPASMRKLTLHNTFLKWDKISLLAELQNLEVLKLLDNAFMKPEMNLISMAGVITNILANPCAKSDVSTVWDTPEVIALLGQEAFTVLATAFAKADRDFNEILNLVFAATQVAFWDTSEVGFSKLKYLKMRGLDIVKWEDQNVQFESLEVLVLEKCSQLETIPFDLALCSSLRSIEVTGCNTSVEKLAKEIEVHHEYMSGNSNLQAFITPDESG